MLSLAFTAGGYALLRSFNKPVVFDMNRRFFFKGHLKRHETPRQKGLEDWCLFDDIHALQIIAERVQSSSSGKNNSSYYSYELNIIKKDASRLNVVDYGNLSAIRKDAQTLANALSVPLWDASP